MTARSGRSPLCTAGVAVALLAFTAMSAHAQAVSPERAKPARPAAHAKPAAPAANQVASGPPADYWSVNYSLPTQYGGERRRSPGGAERTPAAERSAPAAIEQTSEFGRIPLQQGSGTVGLTTSTQMSRTEFYDGRAVPGLNANTQKPPTYVGMSLSVPSGNKGMPIPLVAPTPWNRAE